MVVVVIGFGSGYLGSWSRLGSVKRIQFHQRFDLQKWINFSEKERNMRRRVLRKRNRNEVKGRHRDM